MASLAPTPVSAIPALTHFAKQPLAEVRTVAQERQPDLKPDGLWVSVEGGDDGWSTWCQAEAFRLDRLAMAHDVTLAADARILLLADLAAFDAFASAYGVPLRPRALPYYEWIDWHRVATAYQGIVIAPYRWERRLDGGLWYYGWDCASGCIWDAQAVAAITVREPAAVAGEAA